MCFVMCLFFYGRLLERIGMFLNFVEYVLLIFIWFYLGCILLIKCNEYKYKFEKFFLIIYKCSGLGVNGLGLGCYLILCKIKYYCKK